MPNIKFRDATLHDSEKVAALINSAYRGDSSKAGWTTEADMMDGQRIDKEGVEELIKKSFNKIIMATDEQENVLGCIHAVKEDDDSLYFGLFAVNPKLQSLGVGKSLLKEIETLAHRWQLKNIRLTVIQFRSELISFYERCGFNLTGKVEEFPALEFSKIEGIRLLEMTKTLSRNYTTE